MIYSNVFSENINYQVEIQCYINLIPLPWFTAYLSYRYITSFVF